MNTKKFETKGARFERKNDGGQAEVTPQELLAEFKTVGATIADFKKKSEDEIKAAGVVAEETKTKLAEAETKQAELVASFKSLETKLIEMDLERKQSYVAPGRVERKTAGQLVTGSQEFKAAEGGKRFELLVEKQDITSLSTSAGGLTTPDRDPEVYRNPERPIRIRDLIPSTPANSGSVEFMRQLVFTNNAAVQGTTSGQGGGELVTKAESNITWELVTLPIPTVAHWVPASRQILSDAPMLQSLIDVDLSYGLDLVSDAQLLNGDGTGQNMTGLMVDTAVSDVGEIATGTSAADLPAAMIDHIRSAVTKCQTSEYYNINGIILNPIDFETLETAKATDGHYILMPFAATNGQPSAIWRVPVIITNAMSEGSFLLGDWTMGAKIRDRESLEIRVAEQHGELFVKNGVVVLAEERYVLTIPRPKAFCKGSFEVASA